MREIKFSGRRIDNGELAWGFGVFPIEDAEGDITKCELYTTSGIVEVDPETVGQYTGRKSTEDEQDIFDGDILEFVIFNYDGSDQGVKRGFVDWDDDAAAYIVREVKGSDEGWWLHFILDNDDGVKVLGNIHQHPELLEG